jgi:hypothetical protein
LYDGHHILWQKKAPDFAASFGRPGSAAANATISFKEIMDIFDLLQE